jgi:hypothetical protein
VIANRRPVRRDNAVYVLINSWAFSQVGSSKIKIGGFSPPGWTYRIVADLNALQDAEQTRA